MQAPVYRLDALAVGEWPVSRLDIGVPDPGGAARLDGLLDINLLEHCRFYNDRKEDLLRLSVN